MNQVESLKPHGVLWTPIRQPINRILLNLPPGVSQKPSPSWVFGILNHCP